MTSISHPFENLRRDTALVKEGLLYVAFEDCRHRYFLSQCFLPGSTEEKIEGLRLWYSGATSSWESVVCWLLCKKRCIKIASIAPHTSSQLRDPEAQVTQTPHETQFEGLERNDLLSRAYQRPCSLSHSASFFTRQVPSCGVHAGPAMGRHALLVALELDRNRVFCLMSASAVLCLSIGISVGAGKHDAGLGVAVGAALFGFVAIIHGAVVSVSYRCDGLRAPGACTKPVEHADFDAAYILHDPAHCARSPFSLPARSSRRLPVNLLTVKLELSANYAGNGCSRPVIPASGPAADPQSLDHTLAAFLAPISVKQSSRANVHNYTVSLSRLRENTLGQCTKSCGIRKRATASASLTTPQLRSPRPPLNLAADLYES